MNDTPSKRPKWITILLVGLPLWLVVSGGLALWYFQHQEEKLEQAEQERFAQSVSASMIGDDLRKIVEIIGERNGETQDAAKNLTRAASMIEGLLGPANTGYQIKRIQGPTDWPLIQVTLTGIKSEQAPLWVVSSYDSRPGSLGVEANATGLSATLAAAQALAGDQPARTIHFVFLPHANSPEAPVLETCGVFSSMVNSTGSADLVLCVEAMGAGQELWLSSRSTDALSQTKPDGLGTVRGAEVVCLGEDVDIASVLFEMGLPAIRVATRPIVTADEPDHQAYSAPTVAASAGRLVELIRRAANRR